MFSVLSQTYLFILLIHIDVIFSGALGFSGALHNFIEKCSVSIGSDIITKSVLCDEEPEEPA